jgi:opacity protein-like surface antigen
MNHHLASALSTFCVLTFAPHAQAGFFEAPGEIMLGGGYLDDPGEGYFFGQWRGTVHKDETFEHTLFLELLGHRDDAVLEFPIFGGGSYFENGHLSFLNVTANYELEMDLSGPLSFYVGGGAGFEFVSVDDRFDISLDNDSNFVGQVFAGFRIDFDDDLNAQIGARYLFRDDFSLLGDQFVTNDSWAFEVSVGFSF